jgi:hypothetical protein
VIAAASGLLSSVRRSVEKSRCGAIRMSLVSSSIAPSRSAYGVRSPSASIS